MFGDACPNAAVVVPEHLEDCTQRKAPGGDAGEVQRAVPEEAPSQISKH